MARPVADRVAGVRRLLQAADRVYRDRRSLIPAIARSTGLSERGVDLGFECLERDATDDDLGALVRAAGSTAHVHVVLSANVFVAPLRAIALARASADRVTVRPSPRDPLLAQALVREAGDEAIGVVSERDVGAIACTAIHVYGRDETIAQVRARARPGVEVRGHGAGLGVAVISERADVDHAADLVAPDVVLFDQRGCLSPRVAVVLGEASRAQRFAEALHGRLVDLAQAVPRGTMTEAERAEATLWQETLRFAGHVQSGAAHAVGVGAAGDAIVIPPVGRHVHVAPASTWESAAAVLAPFARYVVAVGCDDPAQARRIVPRGVRAGELGRMQRPPLDGPVDTRE